MLMTSSEMSKLKCNSCQIVINEVLCFCQNKLDVMNNVSLALLCKQSFGEEEIYEAKCLLFESIPQRLVKRKGEDRKQKNIDDIIGVLRSAEPDDIPIFVAKDLHKLPPVTFDHVDATRLLKDILLLQTQVRDLQGKQDEYMTRKDFEKYVEDKENNPDTLYGKKREMEPCVNSRRGGCCLQDSYDSTSGPMGLMTDLGSDTPPSLSTQERVTTRPSPSYASAAAVSTGEPLSVVPGQKRQHVEAHRGQEAHCGGEACTSHVPNVEAVARAPQPSSSLPTDAVTSREITTGGAGEAEIQNNSEGEWVQVVRRKASRFKGMRGTASVDPSLKLKAADVQIPLFIYNVSKENTEQDVADYVFEKTHIRIAPEKVRMKSARDYISFKFYIPKSKLSLFSDDKLWPQGIYFRRFIIFRNVKKTLLDQEDNKNNGSGQK